MKIFAGMLTACLGLVALSGCGNREGAPTGELIVGTQPEGAVVEVNGEVLGTTPLRNSDVQAGKLLLTLRKEGYETERRSVDLPVGQRAVKELNLRPVRGLVLIRSNPPGAAVSIGEVYEGATPLALHDIPLGAHRARLVKSGYNDREIEFSVEDRVPKALDVDLVSNSGTLVVHSDPSGATLFVDGRNEGLTPVSIERIEKGERDIALEMPGYLSYRRSVRIGADDTARVDAQLVPLPGGLSVISVPTGARVYVNGEFKGEAPVNLTELEPGAYNLRVNLRGYADQSRTVQVHRGGDTVEEFDLERNSGTLQIVTRPAGVRVNVDGEYMGTTEAPEDRTDVLSEPLQIDMLSQGSHTLQLVREGYGFETKRFFITKDEVTTLEETLERKFIPNVLVRTGGGRDDAIEAVLVRRHWNGDLELEIRKGVFRTLSEDQYVAVEPLKQEEDVEAPAVPTPEPPPTP